MKFVAIGDSLIFLAHIANIDFESETSWTVYLSNGMEYTVEGEDIVALATALGLA